MVASASSSSSTLASGSAPACRLHRTGQWTIDEHERFIDARTLHPTATWRLLAAYVGTRSTRQCMTHANKIAEKAERTARGLQKAGRPRGATSRQNGPASRKRPSAKPYERQRVAATRTSTKSTDVPITIALPDMFPSIGGEPKLEVQLIPIVPSVPLLLPVCWIETPPISPMGVADFAYSMRPFETDGWEVPLLYGMDDFEAEYSIAF